MASKATIVRLSHRIEAIGASLGTRLVVVGPCDLPAVAAQQQAPGWPLSACLFIHTGVPRHGDALSTRQAQLTH
jgi:hypothetical protein